MEKIEKIFFHDYKLEKDKTISHLSTDNIFSGTLLKIQFSSGVGFCSIHPWKAFGDKSLQKQLDCLSKKEKTPLLESALNFALLDARARTEQRSLWEGIDIPTSHFNLGDLLNSSVGENKTELQPLFSAGFTHIKIKQGKDITSLADRLNALSKMMNDKKWRIDFNSILNTKKLEEFWMCLSDKAKEQIDFLEDPCPMNKSCIAKITSEIPMAVDFEIKNLEWILDCGIDKKIKNLVIKPAIQSVGNIMDKWGDCFSNVIITSYMDHPVGQCLAAYWAGKIKKKYPEKIDVCGLNSHWSFKKNGFSKNWIRQEVRPHFQPPEGNGFGFTQELENIKWQELK